MVDVVFFSGVPREGMLEEIRSGFGPFALLSASSCTRDDLEMPPSGLTTHVPQNSDELATEWLGLGWVGLNGFVLWFCAFGHACHGVRDVVNVFNHYYEPNSIVLRTRHDSATTSRG